MPKIGVPELIIILVIVLVIFGVGKLPQIGGALGKSIKEFHKAKEGDSDADAKKQSGAAVQSTSETQAENKSKS